MRGSARRSRRSRRRDRSRSRRPARSATTASSTRATRAPRSASASRWCAAGRSRVGAATGCSGCDASRRRAARKAAERPRNEAKPSEARAPAKAGRRAKSMSFTSLLVANRGEIARRVMRSARAMGIRCVAVYVDADAAALHVSEADEGVRLATSSLDGKAILDAARATGAGAIHPGYGFLSENAAFAADVIAAGLVWVGPPPEAIARMGDKLAAKALAEEIGVP